MNKQIANGLRVGLTFGIVNIFLFLIKFPVIAGTIIKKIIPNFIVALFPINPDILDILIFIGLIGIWAGASGGRKLDEKSDNWLTSFVGGAAAGLVNALLIGALVFILGSLTDAHVKINAYLAAILPAVVKLFLLDQNTLNGSLTQFVFSFVAGALGGVLGFAFRGQWFASLKNKWNAAWASLTENPQIKKTFARPIARIALSALGIAFLLFIPQIAGKYWNYTIGTVGIYVLLGLGLNIVVGFAGLLDLGYVAFFAIGAYTVALLTAPNPHHLMWNFWTTLPIGVVLAAAAGILLGIPVLRMRGDYLAIVTLGFGEIIRILATSDLLTSFTGGPRGVTAIGQPTLFGKPFSSDTDFVYIIFIGIAIAIFITIQLRSSRIGRAWEAMREDETVAQAMGINTLSHKLMAFAIGAALAGLGGVLFASRNQFTGPEDHNLMVSINVLSVVIVGGMGSIPGVIAGAFALKGLPEILREVQDYRILIFGALLVAMMIWRPEGLWPTARRSMELHSADPEDPESGEAKTSEDKP
ncbi:MAG: hypothetical protein LC099_01370 [Anaerolineales bacterium]|nr:hypothetical protein [Anaerolineales bacterium]